ncbi:MAG: CHAP domain-containing protein [Acetobacter indonesiensis]|nr:CHAP domain-containing protein [Acetobacter indonesiensis]MCI1438342.1 CHAP domain-containing protein [Acetobacter indonesiensis]MCI1547055.1 CHAP domain-containing protein [Acetobacter indonesiensis]MCI1766407.1 CHAP domain-containing protein [Acetobacter indonesiensis]
MMQERYAEMRDGRPGTFKLKMAVVSLLSLSAFISPASAKSRHVASHGHSHAGTHRMVLTAASFHAAGRYAGGRWHPAAGRHYRGGYSGGHVIQCVAYAKTASDVMLHGNARDWWHNASGVYDRGSAPEPGSVLNFRSTRRMPLGHVAVVRNIVDNRTITIDQSHWAQNGISRNVQVIDVSPNNDWSAVRVALNNRSGGFGSIYPTYGFIYGRHAGSSSHANEVMTAWNKKLHQGSETQLAQAPANARPITSGAEEAGITFDNQN